MQSIRRIAVPAYLIAALLILFPLLDTALSVLPPRLGEVSWRFGAAGLFSRALMTPLLGFLLAYAVALLLEQRRVLRAFSVLNAVLAVVLLGATTLFILDAVQMRAQVNPQAKTAFDVATLVALAKYGLGMVVTVAFAVTGWKGSRRDLTQPVRGKRTSPPLVGRAPSTL